MSRIGKKPIAIPSAVKLEIKGASVCVEGPKGKLSLILSDRINAAVKDNQLFLNRSANTKLDRTFHGASRAFIFNMIKGVSEGYSKDLEIIGVGFKAQVQGNILNMQLGFSHPVNFPIPQGIKIDAPKPTQISIKGIDKSQVGQVASQIRAIYPPEPYKGKGIRFVGEHVKKKVGKAQASGTKGGK